MSQPAFDFGSDRTGRSAPVPSDQSRSTADAGSALDGEEPLDDPSNPTYSVGELAEAINDQMRRGFSDGVWVRGEISGWNKSSAGHIYFDLVDSDADNGRTAKLKVAFFAGAQHGPRLRFKRAGLKLGEGLKVRIFGSLDFYAPAGSLSLRMTDVDPRFTLGELSQARDQVVRRLVATGLFDANRRHALAAAPLRVGVVTSIGTAAWHDFSDELDRSGFGFQLLVCDTRVQGEWAVGMVVASIRTLGRRGDVDCVVVIRGGGARNELATFDAEPIALAIATCPVPVLTGLGHEVDRSVADEVAHTALKTPTACAGHLVDAVHDYVTTVEERWASIGAVARHELAATTSALSDRAHRIARRTHAAVERADERLTTRVDRVRSAPARRLGVAGQRVAADQGRLLRTAPRLLIGEERHLDAAASRLALLDPVNLLRRGWSITRQADGRVVRSHGEVAAGAVLVTGLADGTVTSRVESTRATPINRAIRATDAADRPPSEGQ